MTGRSSRATLTGERVFSARRRATGRASRARPPRSPRWAGRPAAERGAALAGFADAVEAARDELADLLVREVGKRRADADGEVAWTARSARWYADHPPRAEAAGGARVLRRPLGVVAAITPWNVPLITPAWKWLPALMAGNAVVWKPSERATATALAAPSCCTRRRARGRAAGAPGRARRRPPALAADARVGAAALHRLGGGGRALAALAAPRFARVALELSGLNPAIVLADADLDLAADCIVACATALAGQKCTATRRVLVDAAVADDARARGSPSGSPRLRVGDPRDPTTDVGPLIAPDGARRGRGGGGARAQAAGARIAAPRPPRRSGAAAFAPALLVRPAARRSAARARAVRAGALARRVPRPAEAWALANAAPYGLSAAVYGARSGAAAPRPPRRDPLRRARDQPARRRRRPRGAVRRPRPLGQRPGGGRRVRLRRADRPAGRLRLRRDRRRAGADQRERRRVVVARVRERAAPAGRARERAVLAPEAGRRELHVARVGHQLGAARARPVLDPAASCAASALDAVDLRPRGARPELARGPVDAPVAGAHGPVLRRGRVAERPAAGARGGTARRLPARCSSPHSTPRPRSQIAQRTESARQFA